MMMDCILWVDCESKNEIALCMIWIQRSSWHLILIGLPFYSRTPGSRQPSPAEEDINKNNGSGSNVVMGGGGKPPSSEGVENHHHHHHHPHINHHSISHHPNHPQHLHQQQQQQATHHMQNHHLTLDSVNQHFEHVMAMDPNGSAMAQFDQATAVTGYAGGGPGMLTPQQQQQAGTGVGGGMDSPSILPPNFDVQVCE
jgi:hypothetical protein